MSSNLYSVPQLSQLQQYNVNVPGQVEGIRQSLYDFQAYAQAGQTSLNFFQTPQGQSSKTLADTNMTAAGQLAAPQSFLIEAIEIHWFPGNSVAPGIAAAPTQPFPNLFDTNAVAKSGWLNLFIGSKSYLNEAPIGRFPPSTGLAVFNSATDTTTAASSRYVYSDYSRFTGLPFRMSPPILLVPTQNFSVSLNWPTAVAVTAAGRIGVVMRGILYRNSQ